MNLQNPLLKAALFYAELGYRVFPCRPGAKTPLTEHGVLDASGDVAAIERWWNIWPNANIGLATDGLVVVDVDGIENPWLKDDPEKLLDMGAAPLSLTANGGRQFLFRQPAGKGYRPKCLQAILGQPKALKILETFARSPRPAAFLFEGESGTGKTSAAIGLAAALGCAVEHAEFGGVWTIASGEQSADAVRDKYRRLSLTPMCGSGWKVAIVNEADRMAKPAETIWLDALENLPPRSVVIFTTNFAGNLSSRFRDRCMRVGFVSDAKALREDAERLVLQIWSRETGKSPPGRTVQKIVAASVESGELSFRRVVQHVERELLEGGAL